MINRSLPIAVFLLLFFLACKKENTNVEVDNETQSAIDNAVAEQEFMGIIPVTNDRMQKSKEAKGDFKLSGIQAVCDTLVKISGDTLWWSNPGQSLGPPTFTLSVSNSTCSLFPEIGNYTRVRSGYIWLRILKKMNNTSNISTPNAIIKLMNYNASFNPTKPIGYTCDSILLTTIQNDKNLGERTVRVQIINGKCHAATWNTEYVVDRYIKIKTFNDNDPSNDIISIWGSSNGKNREGRTFSVTVDASTPLVKHSNCAFISYGVLNLTPDGFKTRTIDYSNGTNQDICDDKASLTVNGVTITFNLN